jgi:hypothetical protein
MTPCVTLLTAQLFQMSCPLISSGVGIRIGSTTVSWLVDSLLALATAADRSGDDIAHNTASFPLLTGEGMPCGAACLGGFGWVLEMQRQRRAEGASVLRLRR